MEPCTSADLGFIENHHNVEPGSKYVESPEYDSKEAEDENDEDYMEADEDGEEVEDEFSEISKDDEII